MPTVEERKRLYDLYEVFYRVSLGETVNFEEVRKAGEELTRILPKATDVRDFYLWPEDEKEVYTRGAVRNGYMVLLILADSALYHGDHIGCRRYLDPLLSIDISSEEGKLEAALAGTADVKLSAQKILLRSLLAQGKCETPKGLAEAYAREYESLGMPERAADVREAGGGGLR